MRTLGNITIPAWLPAGASKSYKSERRWSLLYPLCWVHISPSALNRLLSYQSRSPLRGLNDIYKRHYYTYILGLHPNYTFPALIIFILEQMALAVALLVVLIKCSPIRFLLLQRNINVIIFSMYCNHSSLTISRHFLHSLSSGEVVPENS